MAQPQLTLSPYSGLEKENFREFEQLLRSILAVAAIPANQQANFLQLHLRDAALRYILTLPDATRQDLALSLNSLKDHFCNPQLQELHVLKLENLKFDPKTDNPEFFLVTLQTKALKAYPDPDPPAVALINGAAPDAAVEQTRFDSDTARRAEVIRSAQEARATQIKRQFIKNMPGWLRAKLLEQPETTSVEDLCIFARKQLSIHNLCKMEDSPMDAFSEMGPTVTDTLVNALTKLSQSQDAMDNRLNEMSEKMEEQTNNITTKLQPPQKNQQQSQRGFNNYRGQNYRGNRGNFRGRSRGNNRGYENSRQSWHNNYGRTFNNQNSNGNVQQQWTNLSTNPAENGNQTFNTQPQNFLVTLQTKALKAYPDPDPPAVAPINGAAPDAAVEQTRFDSDTARRAEIIRSAQEARATQIKRQFIKNMPGWLRAKLLEQPETTSVEDLCIFARKQLSIHNLCKTEDSPMDAFSEMGPTVTDTLVNALTKLSHSQEAMDNRLNEMSKKMEEQTNNITTKLQQTQKHQQQSQRGFNNYRGQNYRGNRGNFRGRSRGNNRGYGNSRQSWHNNYGRTFNNQNSNENVQQQWTNLSTNPAENGNQTFNTQPTFEVFTPDPNYMPYTQQSTRTCYNCGYPNHLAKDCTVARRPPSRAAQMPFNQNQKN